MRYAVLMIIAFSLLAGCSPDTISGDSIVEEPAQDEGDTQPSQHVVEEPSSFTIKTEGSFEADECRARNLEDKFIMIESKYCGHCQRTLPDFKAACEEAGIDCTIIDLANERDRLQEYNIRVQYTPTFIFDCDYFVGSMDKQEYIDLIEVRKDG